MRPTTLFPSQEAHEWLRLAARDIRLAELALGDSPPLVGEALYHAQQAAEKALKGYLVNAGVPYPLTHDVRRLVNTCGETDPELMAILLPATGLTQFATRFRYPGEDQPHMSEAQPWLSLAKLVVAEVARRVPTD